MMMPFVEVLLSFFSMSILLLDDVECSPAHSQTHGSKDDADGTFDLNSGNTPIFIIAASSVAFLAILVMVVAKCADCYNSEVSSENHPACAEKQYKWGGAVGYMSANSTDPSAGYGERVELNQSQSLPYTMIPTSVPASAGFQGYSAVGQAGNSQPEGTLGYTSSVRSNSSYGTPASRHYNPAEPQEPPPTYNEAASHARGGSFHGNR